ncbi:hypothetical protein PSN13_06340 [Micromonospora saelicesensis]|uniref:Uncharacterized protein n=1 Tax=Micromonospora saelicesensis TaxID=285676 RepID=A0A328NBM4_9ACTN|nr:hypothetical protein [Micromonospora saelicesensis]RAO26316.1 hypothetical protein PSN13_06340 [Micromonospora saelicesensis]
MTTEESFAAEKQVAKEDMAAAQVPENRGRQRPRSTYVVAALVVVLFAALGTAAFVGRGTVKSDDLLVTFAWMLIPPLVGAVVALAFGRRLMRRMPQTAGTAPATKRRVERALRDGSTDDPQLDALARKEAQLRLGQRWLLLLFAVVILTQLPALVNAVNPFTRVLAVLLILIMLASAWYRWRGLREARRYLAGPPSQP